MSRAILILGGTGRTGRVLGRHLLAASDVRVTLASRRPERAADLVAQMSAAFGAGRLVAVKADASDSASLRSAFAGHDLILVASPTTTHTVTVARAALAVGADYLDVQFSGPKLAVLRSLEAEIGRNGRCFITEAGFHPGLPAALVRYAGARIEGLEAAVVAAYLNMGRDLPFSEAVDEVAEAFRDYRGRVLRAGAWTPPSSYEVRRLDLGGEIGRRRCYSMYFEELGPLPALFPTLRELGFYMCGVHWVTDFVISPLVWLGVRLVPGSVRPAGRLLWWGMRTFHRPPYRVEIQIRAQGRKGGREAALKVAVAHSDGYELTAVPVVAALAQYLDGSARKPGLWMMGHLVDPSRLLKDMAALGVQVREEWN